MEQARLTSGCQRVIGRRRQQRGTYRGKSQSTRLKKLSAKVCSSTVCRELRDTGTARPSWVEAASSLAVVWVGQVSERFTVER